MKEFSLENLSMESLGQVSSDLDMTIDSSQLILNETIDAKGIDRSTMESFYNETQVSPESNKNFPLVTFTKEPSSQNLDVSIEMMETVIGKFAGMSTQVMLLSSKAVAFNEALTSIDTNWDMARSKLEEASRISELTESEVLNRKDKLEGESLSQFASQVEVITLNIDDVIGGI